MIGTHAEMNWISSEIHKRFELPGVCWSHIHEASLRRFGFREEQSNHFHYQSKGFTMMGLKISPLLVCEASHCSRNVSIKIMEVSVAEIPDLNHWFSLSGVIEVYPAAEGAMLKQSLRVDLARRGPLRCIPRHGLERILHGVITALDARVNRAVRRRLATWSSGGD